MKLISLKIDARGSSGWASDDMHFGDHITQLFGPNGCGKTPMLQAIAYALGHKTAFRDDLNENCEFVTLTLTFDGTTVYELKRTISSEFHIGYKATDGAEGSCHNELEFAEFFFEQLGWENKRLTTVGNKPSYAYVTMLLPLFYLDQDNGYSDQYFSPVKFIKDQYVEMARLAVGAAPKHLFDRKRDLFIAKQNLEITNKQIIQSEAFLESLYKQSAGSDRSSESLASEIEETNRKLEDLRDSSGVGQRASQAVYEVINSKIRERSQIEKEISNITQQVESYSSIASEIDAEISTLNLNESARRAFDAFDEICGQASCGLFMASSKSYGKHLLYLRDQLKDLNKQSEAQLNKIAKFEKLSQELLDEITQAKKEVDTIEDGNFAEHIALATKELMTRVFELEKQKQIAILLEKEKARFFQLSNQREELNNKTAALGGRIEGTDLSYLKFRQSFKAKLLRWMNTLNTKNVSRDISIDNDLRILFGSEKLTVHKGSTLLRLVLAIRAAFFECTLEINPESMNFLIFDTPRQQDIETADFSNFIDELKKLCSGANAQVVFSTTEYRYTPDVNDIEWTPQFQGEEQNMFLKPLR